MSIIFGLILIGFVAWCMISFLIAVNLSFWIAEKCSGIEKVGLFDDGFWSAAIMPIYVIIGFSLIILPFILFPTITQIHP